MMSFSLDNVRACFSLSILLAASIHLASCSHVPSIDESAYIVPDRLKIRSSTAQASRITGELKSGDRISIRGRANSENGTPWVKIVGPGGESGWAEARYFVKSAIVEESRRIAEEIKDIQTQAVGKSKAPLKLRLTPDRSNDDNVAILVLADTKLEIVGRERRPRPVAEDEDDMNTPPTARNTKVKPHEIKYDDWLLVRVKAYPVLPAGWIYGGSVILEIPGEIIYFASEGRRITGWQKIGAIRGVGNKSGNHFLVLERKIINADEQVDFDRVKVLAYDPVARNYYTPFSRDISGRLPVTLKMDGTRGQFQLSTLGKDLKPKPVSFRIEVAEGEFVKVTEINESRPEQAGLTLK